MLREFGVDGIKVQEVVGLDEELLAFLPYVSNTLDVLLPWLTPLSKPVYGLIFLFQFQDDDPTKQEATCPDHVWFANQVSILVYYGSVISDRDVRLPAMHVHP
jgi:ubiquitin carboxyl-terminal hydrolase L5